MHGLIAPAAKALIGVLVLASGFTAVSDDDFARVVLMQSFAHDPALDPTGTSWLPFPFWLNGAAMMLLGTSLQIARALAFAWGLVSAWLLYRAGRLLVATPGEAVAGAVLAAALPWSARLGVATVPELLTASLTVFAIASLAGTPSLRPRLLGAAALTVACLSRYEPWFVALVFAAYSAWDARKDRRIALASGLALLGPALWIAHNAAAHGDALHFVARVSAYKKALGGEGGWLVAVAGYPLSLLREEPEIVIGVLALLGLARWKGRALPQTLPRVALANGVLLLGLTAAALPGGAPTHHAGRALLCIWLCAALYVGAALWGLRGGPSRSRIFAALAVAAVVVLGAAVLRPWYARLNDSWAHREAALRIGQAAAEGVPGQVLVEVRDYGFFAVQAGSGEPWRFVPDRSVDPRQPKVRSSFDDAEALRRRVADFEGVVGYRSDVTASALGAPEGTVERWAWWRSSR